VRLRRNFYDSPVELGTHVDAFHWGVTAVAVLSDGCVVTAGSDWRVRLWRTTSRASRSRSAPTTGRSLPVAMLSDGSVVTGGRDGRVRLWRTDQPGVPMALSADDDDQMDK
jgi:WD40 repeat protein